MIIEPGTKIIELLEDTPIISDIWNIHVPLWDKRKPTKWEWHDIVKFLENIYECALYNEEVDSNKIILTGIALQIVETAQYYNWCRPSNFYRPNLLSTTDQFIKLTRENEAEFVLYKSGVILVENRYLRFKEELLIYY